jgi:hypothetical protein
MFIFSLFARGGLAIGRDGQDTKKKYLRYKIQDTSKKVSEIKIQDTSIKSISRYKILKYLGRYSQDTQDTFKYK